MNKKIYLYDCDFISNPKDIYNAITMKISSYHKQNKDSVYLIRNPEEKIFLYDVIYVIREKWTSKLPPAWILDDKNTITVGDAMELFNNHKELPWQIAAVRPDYLLFPQEISTISYKHKAQFIQFFSGTFELPMTQDYLNGFKGKKLTLCSDSCFFMLPYDIIKKKLKILLEIPNIGFQYPIQIKPLVEDKEILELFSKLNFCKMYRNKFQNNYGNSVEKLKEIIDALSQINSNQYFKPFKIQSITKAHQTNLDARTDLWRDFEVLTYAKQKQVRINMTCPRVKNSYYWEYFKMFKEWSNHYYKKSYIEYMLLFSTRNTLKEQDLLNDSKYWLSLRSRELIYLITHYPNLMEQYMHIQWGDEVDDIKVDLDYLRKEY